MRKIYTTVLFWFIIGSYTEAQDIFKNKIDTLLLEMNRLITSDLSNDNIEISSRPWIGLGVSFELTIIFDSKHAFQITSLSRPDSLTLKSNKWELTNNIKRKMLMDYIYANNELPYNMIECFSYKFLQVQLNGDFDSDALFGEYFFNADSCGFTIIDKKIEMLNSKESIINKQLSKW